jgi:glycerol-3-phosphate acyltransferase PlsY
MIYQILAIIIISFILGSVPTAYLLVKIVTGKDLREVGSGNIGGSNARRAADNKDDGFFIYWTVATVDALKGLIPVLLMSMLVEIHDLGQYRDLALIAAALIPIIGHDTMVFLKNGKGKGVGTTIGAFFILVPIPVIIGLVIFFTLHILVKMKNAAIKSIITALSMATACIILNYSLTIKIGFLLAIFILIARHKGNISEIISKKKNK